jgi:hypothetical protein
VAAHVDAQIRVQAPAAGGHQTAEVAHRGVFEFTDGQGGRHIDIFEPGAHSIPAVHVLPDIVGRLPPFGHDDGDHGFHQQGVGAGPHRQVKVGDGGGFAAARIDGDQQPVGILAESGQDLAGLGHLVALHAVPPPGNDHIGGVLVGDGDIVLPPEHTPRDPPGAAEFLSGRGIKIAGPHRPQQSQAEGGLEMAALGAAPHVGQTARPVLIHQ